MRDDQRQPRFEHHRLRGDTAGPEHRHEVVTHDRRGLAVVGPHDIRDANPLGQAEVDGRAVDVRDARRDLDRADGVGRRHHAHRDDHLAPEGAGGHAIDVGAEHRDYGIALDVVHRDAGLDQRRLERERAAEHEGNHVVGPKVPHVRRLVDALAVTKYTIARQVGADVDITEIGQRGIADRAHADHRAGLRVALAEGREIGRVFLLDDAQVALHIPRRDAGGVAGQLAPAAGEAGLVRRVSGGPVAVESRDR